MGRVALLLALCVIAKADLVYERATRITGGKALRFIEGLPAADALREPERVTIRIRGQFIARRQGDVEELFDLGKKTVTMLDHAHKSYTVESFEAYRKAHASTQTPNAKADYSVYTSHNGEPRELWGVKTVETTISVTVDLPGGEKRRDQPLEITSQVWSADEAPGWPKVAEAVNALSEALGVDLFAPDLAVRLKPEAMEALRRATAETLKLSGAVLEQTVSIDGPAASALDTKMMGKAAQSTVRSAATRGALSKVGHGIGSIISGGVAGAASSGPAGDVAVPDKAPGPKLGTQHDTSQDVMSSNAALELLVKTMKYTNAELSDADFAVPEGYAPASAGRR